ncbi:MAG: helix-turn-helix transcriptional regulator [Oscillospiraceae bacterium]
MNKIKDLRIAKGMSQSELAKQLFVNQTAVSQWERGATMPGKEILVKLSKMFNTSIDYIVGISNIPDAYDTDSADLIDCLSSAGASKLRYLLCIGKKTAQEYSEASNVPIAEIENIMNGSECNPRLNTISALVKVIGMTLDDFLLILDVSFYDTTTVYMNFTPQAIRVARAFDSSNGDIQGAVLKILDIWEKPVKQPLDNRKNA